MKGGVPMKRILKIVSYAIFIGFSYLFIFAVLVYKVHQPLPTDLSYDVSTFKTTASGETYAYLVEERYHALEVRLALIEKAQETIDVSYYAMHPNQSRDIFYGALLEAAERDVMVRIIVDGFIEGGVFGDREIVDALIAHENITFSYYEPVNLLRPYAIQNRLHDKLLLIDDQYGLTGGRNIGDRYFMDLDDSRDMVHDRDVLIFGLDHHETVITMREYFDTLFNSRYSAVQTARTSSNNDEIAENLRAIYRDYVKDYDFTAIENTILNGAILVNRATFIHSPLNRMQKHPVVLETMLALAEDYDTVFVQSPYVILDRAMREMFNDYDDKTITILTNNWINNPNIFAVSGYMRIRNDLAATTDLYEYYGEIGIHSKTILMGSDLSIIGSFNIDPRSAFLSTESMIVIYSETFTSHMYDTVDTYIADSYRVDASGDYIERNGSVPSEASRLRKIAVRITMVLTWFFDEML